MRNEFSVYPSEAEQSNASLSLSFLSPHPSTDTMQTDRNLPSPNPNQAEQTGKVDRLIALCSEMWEGRLFDTQAALIAAESIEQQSRALVDAAVPGAKTALVQRRRWRRASISSLTVRGASPTSVVPTVPPAKRVCFLPNSSTLPEKRRH